MTPSLLICAAIDFEEAGWVGARWQSLVESLKPGIAGDIWQWQENGAGFASRDDRPLSTRAPEVRAREPHRDEAGQQTLLAGRIFHRERLAKELDVSSDSGDSALYAAAYRRWGESCDTRILGSYAVVQWHSGRGELRMARSPLQAPPLHIWRSGAHVIAASLPATIFAAGVSPKVSMDHIANVALRNFTDPSRSYYHDLSRVAPGTQVMIDRERIRRTNFWQPRNIQPAKIGDATEAYEHAERLMRDAVAVSLEGSSQPAISLSGGLDSQTIASFALEHLGDDKRLRSYTSVPVHEWLPKQDNRLIYDESENVRALAQHWRTLDSSFVSGEELQIGAYSHELMQLGAWPTANEMNMHWVHAIHRQAASDGGDIMLHAELGDSSISYDALTAFPQWLVRGLWRKLSKELKLYRDDRPILKRGIALALLPWLPKGMRRTVEAWRGGANVGFERWSALRADTQQAKLALSRAVSDGHDFSFYGGTDSLEAREAMIAAPLSEGPELDLALQLLHGLSRRDPTAYLPLWEYCASLPDDVFIRDGKSRRLARELMTGRAPDQIVNQTRVGIQSADFRGRLERDAQALISEVSEMRQDARLNGIIDLDRIHHILERCLGPEELREKDWLKLASLVPRGIALARFIRHVERQDYG